MSLSRTTALGILCSTVAVTVVGAAAPAISKPIWCEEAAPYGCSRWHATADDSTTNGHSVPAGLTSGQYFKLLDDRTL